MNNSQKLTAFRILLKCINLFIFPILFFSCESPSKITFQEGTLNQIFNIAKTQNKKVFVLITDSTCNSCKSFEQRLIANNKTTHILANEYICYKIDIKQSADKKIAEIVKNPSYPFPYFFDSNGTLLAFGFPNNKDFDISDLSDVSVSKNAFNEQFRLPITIEDYKKLVTLNLQATLSLYSKMKSSRESAYVKIRKSIEITGYPYNIKMLLSLDSNSEDHQLLLNKISKYKETASDRFLYGNILHYISLVDTDIKKLSSFKPIDRDFEFDSVVKNLGTIRNGFQTDFWFKLKNTSSKVIYIENVSHPCDCIHLICKNKKVGVGEEVLIEGKFKPYQKGNFEKEIFVHTSSEVSSMDSFKIIGIVN